MWKSLFIVSVLSCACYGQSTLSGSVSGSLYNNAISAVTVSQLPTIVPPFYQADQTTFTGGRFVSDGATATDCTVGHGSNLVFCYSNGLIWTGNAVGGAAAGSVITGVNTASSNTLTLVKGANSTGSSKVALSIQEQDQHGFMAEWHVPAWNSSVPYQGYIDNAGAIFMGTDIVVSGHNTGASWIVPSPDPFMIGCWADVQICIESRTNLAGDDNYIALDHSGNYVLRVGDGPILQMGAGSTEAGMDITLRRATPSGFSPAFAIDSGTAGTGGNLQMSNNTSICWLDTAGACRSAIELDSGNNLYYGFQVSPASPGQTIILPAAAKNIRFLNNAQSAYIANMSEATQNTSFGDNVEHNYKVQIDKSGSTGTLYVKDNTATTGFTRALFDLGAADTILTNLVTNNGGGTVAGIEKVGAISANATAPAASATGCTLGTVTGGNLAGSIAVTAGNAACVVTLTWSSSIAFAHGAVCSPINDITTVATANEASTTTTSVTFRTMATTTSDTLLYSCVGY